MVNTRKVVLSATVDIDAFGLPQQASERALAVHPSRREIVCLEVAPHVYIGLTNERRTVSLLEVDESLFIFAPRRLSAPRLQELVERLLHLHTPQQATPEDASSLVRHLLLL